VTRLRPRSDASQHVRGSRADNRFNETARRLRNAVEPVAAWVYFVSEAHAAYAVLGFNGSPITQPRRACAVLLARVSRLVPEAGRGRQQSSAVARSSAPG
jgi:hypothetical protein